MNTIHYIIVTIAFLLASATNAAAQTDRNLIRQGNRAFKTQKWAAAETQYRKAISKNQKNPQYLPPLQELSQHGSGDAEPPRVRTGHRIL